VGSNGVSGDWIILPYPALVNPQLSLEKTAITNHEHWITGVMLREFLSKIPSIVAPEQCLKHG
jgi:hypothetical protein